jgi:excisionase family DNA binding protein
MEKLLTVKQVSEILHVHGRTLKNWDTSGKLPAIKTQGGHRRYKESQIESLLGIKNEAEITIKKDVAAIYARTSSHDQKNHGDLDRQSNRISQYCANMKYNVSYVINDVGSGLNDKRAGFIKLCNLVINKSINKVVIENKDRLTRFQFNLIEIFFKSYDVDIIITNKKEITEEEELVNDVMMLMASFSGKLYGKRSAKKRKTIQC